jgi:hypothetical protein
MRMPESLKTDTDFERLSPLFSQDYLDHLEESIKAHFALPICFSKAYVNMS